MEPRTRHLLKVGLLASALEWYEFSIYGFLAGILGQVFFKSTSSTLALIQAFAIFSLSHLARPIGSLFFSMLGNRLGANQVLKASLLLMAVPTVMIGFLPTYEQIGSLATLALLILRLLQGFAAGGELPANACYIFEESTHTPFKSLLCSSVAVGPLVGILLGSVVTSLMQLFTQESLLAWAWRIPFWLGLPLTLFINYIRLTIPQSPLKKINRSAQSKGLVRPLIKGMGLMALLASSFQIIAIWMPTYLSHFLYVPSNIAQLSNTLTLCAIVIFCLIAGLLSHYYTYRKVIVISAIAIVLLVYPIFIGLQTTASFSKLLALQVILALFVCGINGTYVEMLGDLFSPGQRLLGISLSLLPNIIIGGTAPVVCSYIIYKTGWLMFPAFYILGLGLLALPIALNLKTSPESLH